jgi:hypothetical protein
MKVTEITTDREGNEIKSGDLVWVANDTMTARGIISAVETYRVQVQINDESYVWAHVADTTLAESH